MARGTVYRGEYCGLREDVVFVEDIPYIPL